MKNILLKRALLASTIAAGTFGFAATAQAQTAEPREASPEAQAEAQTGDEREIIVTGSRITNPNLVQSSPVAVIGAEEISFQQPTSAEELLRDLPGATPGTNSQVNNGSNGSARVNLRGLGSFRNLVLLNSRRITPRDTDGVVDLNVIPVALIERTEVFTGGASTVYGADAVAGVVNFITRRDFAGIDINANYGITERGDGANYRVDLTTGANFDDGRGNVALSLSYTNTEPVLHGNRSFSNISRQSTKCTAIQVTQGCSEINNTTIGFPQGSPVAAPASIGSPFTGRVDASGTQFIAGAQNDYNFAPLNLFQTPLERYSVYGQGRYEVSPAVEIFTEAMFVKTIVELNLAPTGVFGQSIQVPLNSPSLSAQQRQFLCTQATGAPGGLPAGANCATAIAAGTPVTVGVQRRFVEAGPRRQTYTTNYFHLNGGARGPLVGELNWELSGGYGESDQIQERRGWGLLSRVQQGVSGCPAGSAAGCVPFNLFGPVGSVTPAMLNFIDIPTFVFTNTTFTSAQAVVTGDLGFSSPFATTPVGIAFGAEYRRYFASSEGDATSRIPGEVLGAGAAAAPLAGSYNSRELFGELNVTLVEDRPFFDRLALEAGARYADYSTSGGNWTYKIGGSWQPIPDVRFRAVYSRAVRAPNIAELFQPQVTALTTRSSDPCQGTLAEVRARGANHETLCRAQLALVGAPGSLLGSIPAPQASQIQSTQGGNPDLDPETAKTFTAGVVLQPRFLPNVAVTLDYFKIDVTDAISSPSQSDVIDGCFNSGAAGLCNSIFRNPLTGSLSGPANTTFGPILATSNLGTINTDGFDLAVTSRHDLGFGRLAFAYNGTYTRNFDFQATPASLNRACVGYYGPNCLPSLSGGQGQPLPKYTSNLRTTFSSGGFDASLLWRYIGAMKVEPEAPVPQVPVGQPTVGGPTNIIDDYRRIRGHHYFDLSLQQSISDNLRLTFTVLNLLDQDPPVVGNTIGTNAANGGNTFPSVYDPLGRRFVMGVNLRF